MMKIQYTYRSIVDPERPSQSYWGTGSMDTFGIGLSTDSHVGTFTNTSDLDLLGPIFVIAAMTDKHIKDVSKLNRIISEKTIPVWAFFFIPSNARASWYQSSLDGNFWASLPQFTLIAGKTYDGYYIPLSALPPFSSRSEIGAVSPSRETLHYSDFFYLSAAYFNCIIDSFSNRVSIGSKVINVVGDDVSYPNIPVRNANSGKTFSNILNDEAEKNGIGSSPKLNIQLTNVKSIIDGVYTYYVPEFTISTNIPKKAKIGLNNVNMSYFGRHGADTIGNSGFTNNKDISQDSILTRANIPTDIKSININNEVRVVSSITYEKGGNKRVNMYVPL